MALWLIADPLLGTLWELAVPQGVWRNAGGVALPPAPARGFYLPYTQPGSLAGRLALRWRRYQLWWREVYWPENDHKIIAFVLGSGLTLLIALSLDSALFWLALLAIFLTLLAGQGAPDLFSPEGGRLQSVVQWLLPWFMGVLLWSDPSPAGLALAVCYWAIYLGGLRMLGQHRRAEILFFAGQLAAILILVALRLLPGAALSSSSLAAQYLLRTRYGHSEGFLEKAQPYLVIGLLVATLSLAWPVE
jgi:hypothetical protein